MRLFYAAFLSRENMQAYHGLIDGIMERAPGVLRSIPRNTQHLTLAFLGEVPESKIDHCAELLTAFDDLDPFPFRLGSPGILMGRGRPRLVFASLTQGKRDVSDVQATLIARLSKLLPELDLRPKPPHVTLARFHRRARRSDARRVQDLLDRQEDDSSLRTDRLSSVHLVRSALTREGPIYESLAEARLGNGKSAPEA